MCQTFVGGFNFGFMAIAYRRRTSLSWIKRIVYVGL